MALTELQIKNIKPTKNQQKLSDGGGMYLLLKPTRDNPNDTKKPLGGGKEWKLAYRFGGKQKTLALGTYPSVTLAQARARRDEAKTLLTEGKDPGETIAKKAKKAVRVEAQIEAQIDAASTFEAVARDWHSTKGVSKKGVPWTEHHSGKILRWLEKDIFPWIGKRSIADITAPELLAVLRRIETRGVNSTAHDVLAILGRVYRFAIVTGRAHHNTAADLRDSLAPVQGENFAAITEPKDIGELLRRIDKYRGGLITRAALALAPMLFVRPGELRKAEWHELDFDAALWTIPAEKMKARREHIVPLSDHAIEIFRELQPFTGSGKYVFSGAHDIDRPMSDGALNRALRAMGYDTKKVQTGHGFRHMASTLLNEQGYNPDAIEVQLAHKDSSTRGTYNKARYLPERIKMMQAWSEYLMGLKKGADVIAIKRA